MSESKDDGGPFHPTFRLAHDRVLGVVRDDNPGASFRAVAAMYAMTGLLSDTTTMADERDVAEAAVRHADALIAELKK